MSTMACRVLLFLLIACTAVSPGPAHAQVGIIAAGITAGLTGNQLLDKARTLVSETLNQAENTGNALLGRAGNEMSVLIATIDVVAGRQLDRSFKELDDKTKQAFAKLNELTLIAENAGSRVYEEKEAAMVDLAARIGDLPLAKEDIFIQTILGAAQLEGDGAYPLTVIATGLGPGAAKKKVSLKVYVKGLEIAPDTTDPTRSNRLVFRMGNEVLKPHFKPGQVTMVPARIVLSVTTPKWWGLSSDTQTVDAPFSLALFPRDAGILRVTVDEPTFVWQPAAPVEDYWASPDCGQGKCGGGVTHTLQVKVAGGNSPKMGNRRIVSFSRRCVAYWGPRACEWSYPEGGNDGYTSAPDGASMTLQMRHTGERVGWYLTAQTQEYAQGPTVEKTFDVKVRYGENIEFVVPKGTTFYKLSGKTLTGRRIEVARSQADAANYLSFVNEFPNADTTKVVYAVKAPQM